MFEFQTELLLREVAAIMSNLGRERTNWEVLSDDLANDGITVAACVMNPKQAGGLQTRERLYQVWYNHEAAASGSLGSFESQCSSRLEDGTLSAPCG